MLKNSKPYEESLLASLRDPAEASAYLEAALKDGDPKLFLLALKNVASAAGGISGLAKKSKLNRETLYRTLSKKGNPELTTLHAILESLGLQISITPKKKSRKAA